MITNDEVLEVNQHSRNNRQCFDRDNVRVWSADALGGSAKYVAVFNLRETTAQVDLPWETLGIGKGTALTRDLWRHKDLGRKEGIAESVASHGSVLYKLN